MKRNKNVVDMENGKEDNQESEQGYSKWRRMSGMRKQENDNSMPNTGRKGSRIQQRSHGRKRECDGELKSAMHEAGMLRRKVPKMTTGAVR